MINSNKRNILFVINPKSEIAQDQNIEKKISLILEKEDFINEFYYTKGLKDTGEVKKIIEKLSPEILVAAGGDGTINLAASIIKNTNIKLGIIPLGSANGLAKNLNIPGNLELAVARLLKDKPKPIDIIEINKRFYCLHLSDVGINARIVKRFTAEGSKGMAGYAKQLFKELFSKKTTFHYDLKTPQKKKKSKAEMIVIANAERFGTGAIINPGGRLNDGKFEIVLIKPYPWWIIFYFILHLFTGQLHKMNYVNIISTNKAKIELGQKLDIQIDGEIIEGIKILDIKILPSAIQII